MAEAKLAKRKKFLSTLPARGATAHPSGAHRGRSISIHAPREGSDRPPIHQTEDQNISIHAPREGSDSSYRPSQQSMHTFLSTLPARGATLFYGIDSLQHYISIHAPREGSDGCSGPHGCHGNDFYPRSPRGERPVPHFFFSVRKDISIHAPREGSDVIADVIYRCDIAFLSTLPARGATS